MAILRKAHVGKVKGLQFVLSDETQDRMGDVIRADGWDLKSFKKNPIALFGHRSDFPIGTWSNIHVEGSKLLGDLNLAPEGTSPRIDEIRGLVEADVLKAVSVGFRPITVKENPDSRGEIFVESELVECSLVSVPANPNALAVAKSLHVSDDTLKIVFGEHAGKGDRIVTRGVPGEHAVIPPNGKSKSMTIAQKIEQTQAGLLALKDQLTEHVAKFDAVEMDAEAITLQDELSERIEAKQKELESLQRTEKALGVASTQAGGGDIIVRSPRPFAAPAKKVSPSDYVMRSLVAVVVGHATKQHPREILIQRYGDDGKVDDGTRAVFDIVTRAASAPADTTTSGWASQLVETSVADFMELLIPASVYPGLAARGLRLNFGRSGIISIPTRSATPTIAGSFVAQGAPIPVRQGAFASVTLTPKKMAVISTFTREIAEHSTPAIEGLIRNAMQEDTSVSLDTILLDATAASTTRPAGIREGVTVTTATAGGGFAALVGDIKALLGALITASNGNVRNPVWIMNPVNAISVALTQNAGGDFPFAAEINQNRLQGYPVILSSTVTAGMVILVDAADFVSVEGDAPRFDVSDQATLHMEDTTPLAIGTAGSPNTVAAPVRSLYQTDSMALRMIMDVNWALRRTGVVAWTQSVTW